MGKGKQFVSNHKKARQSKNHENIQRSCSTVDDMTASQ